MTPVLESVTALPAGHSAGLSLKYPAANCEVVLLFDLRLLRPSLAFPVTSQGTET